MGRTSVKQKPKQMTFKFTKREEILLNIFEDRLNHELKTFVRPIDLENLKTLNAIATTFEAHNERISKIENMAAQPCINVETTKISQDLIDALKNSKPKPKISQWRNAEERCIHTINAVKEALILMHGINIISGNTSFVVKVKCQGYWRDICVHFNGTKHCSMTFYRRNGQFINKEFTNTTQAAANIVAVCMYYATR